MDNITSYPLTELIIGNGFNRNILSHPLTIKTLRFECNFNKPIDNLPPSVEYLMLGYCFNQPVNNLPSSLRHLF